MAGLFGGGGSAPAPVVQPAPAPVAAPDTSADDEARRRIYARRAGRGGSLLTTGDEDGDPALIKKQSLGGA